MKKTILILTAAFFILSCSKRSTPQTSTNVNKEAPTVTAKAEEKVEPVVAKADAKLGNEVYNAKCGKCHELKKTTDYTCSDWTPIMNSMAPKANLSEIEKQHVMAYVKSACK